MLFDSARLPFADRVFDACLLAFVDSKWTCAVKSALQCVSRLPELDPGRIPMSRQKRRCGCGGAVGQPDALHWTLTVCP